MYMRVSVNCVQSILESHREPSMCITLTTITDYRTKIWRTESFWYILVQRILQGVVNDT